MACLFERRTIVLDTPDSQLDVATLEAPSTYVGTFYGFMLAQAVEASHMFEDFFIFF